MQEDRNPYLNAAQEAAPSIQQPQKIGEQNPYMQQQAYYQQQPQQPQPPYYQQQQGQPYYPPQQITNSSSRTISSRITRPTIRMRVRAPVCRAEALRRRLPSSRLLRAAFA